MVRLNNNLKKFRRRLIVLKKSINIIDMKSVQPIKRKISCHRNFNEIWEDMGYL